MQTAPEGVVKIDSRIPARKRAERLWAPQAPANRVHRRRPQRKSRVATAQLVGTFVGGAVFAFTPHSMVGIYLTIVGYVAPAVIGGWLDAHRPIGRPRNPGRHDLAVALQLDPQEGTE